MTAHLTLDLIESRRVGEPVHRGSDSTVCRSILHESQRNVDLGLIFRPMPDLRPELGVGTVRREEPELSLAAVRQVIANAVAHRDYRSVAPVQLRLDDAGLSVWNPGTLRIIEAMSAMGNPAARFEVSQRSATLDLESVERLGLVTRVGVGRASRWVGR